MFIGTPKGKNHFYKIYRRAVEEEWFNASLPASVTGILSEETLAIQKAEQTQDQYDQEYECSFEESQASVFDWTAIEEAAKGKVKQWRV